MLTTTSMADPAQRNSGGGCLSKLVFLILMFGAGGLGWALFLISLPQNLSDLTKGSEAAPAGREMKVVLKNAIDRGYPVTLSEAEINNWLGRTLTVKQGGLLESKASLDRVWVRLEDGVAEVIMARKFMGKPFTVSMFLQVEQLQGPKGVNTEVKLHGGPFHPDFPNPPRGGRFGQLVVPQGFLLLVMPAYQKLTGLFPEEINLGFEEMSRIKIEKGRLVLDPRAASSMDSLMPETF
jgi:hypothetical protein